MLRIIKKYMGVLSYSKPFLQCGIDINSSSYRAVIVRHSYRHTKPHSYFIADSKESLKASLIKHFGENRPNFYVVIAAPEEGLFSQILEIPTPLTSFQLEEQIQLVLKRHFSQPSTDFYYDYQPLGPQKLWLMAIPHFQLLPHLAWLKGLGIRKIAIDVERWARSRGEIFQEKPSELLQQFRESSSQFPNFINDEAELGLALSLAQWQGNFYDITW